MISGQDGILTRVGNASVQNDVASTKEQIQIELMGKYNEDGEYTNADVITAVENATGNRVEEKTKTVLSKNNNEVDISDLWVPRQLNEIKIGETITAKSEYVEKDTGYKITIPAGYTIHKDSATNISDGIVIVDDDGNEFVWVPVPNAIANTEEEIETMVKNKQYPIAVPTGKTDSNGNTAYRGVVYDFTSEDNGNVTIKSRTYSEKSGSKEPAYLNDENYGDASENGKHYLRSIIGMIQTDDAELQIAWINQLQTEFDEMVENVALAGGYYVSRYEISGTIDTNGDINSESKPETVAFTGDTSYNETEKFRWYGLYKAGKSYTHNGVKSTMIWGSQYDQMMIWMVKKNDITKGDNIKYNQDSLKTGVYGSNDIINKVYDLYGGRSEWTMLSHWNSFKAVRGGNFNHSNPVANYYYNYPTDNIFDYSSRLALYIM